MMWALDPDSRAMDYLWHVKHSSPLGANTMSAQLSSDVRALFVDLGIEFGEVESGLVIDRFSQWVNQDPSTVRASTCVTRIDDLRELEAAA
ncbi:hypothetical protein [Amycolatopsis sp. NPDC098790]|uniref:hypothetical protein n=1 Tax=Amycolatopsis sp. NPDC098790 TaxID=3363939 RepID=UPI0037F5427A